LAVGLNWKEGHWAAPIVFCFQLELSSRPYLLDKHFKIFPGQVIPSDSETLHGFAFFFSLPILLHPSQEGPTIGIIQHGNIREMVWDKFFRLRQIDPRYCENNILLHPFTYFIFFLQAFY
jgi:hypothetical protein